jgi:uncharacterized protein YbaP (TraB family)
LPATPLVGSHPLAAAPVWVIRDADSTIVLFGSVHILPRGVEWAPKALTDALAGADDLWFEIPPDDATAAEVSALAAQHALLPPGRTLSSLLDAKSRSRLHRVAGSVGLPVSALDPLQPWMAEIQLMVAFLAQRGGLIAEGVEDKVSAMAPPTVQRRSFETAGQQVGTLSGGDLATQTASLKETLRELADDPDSFDRMVRAWASGDVKRLSREAVEPLRKAAPKSYQSLVVARNREWTKIIAERLAGSGKTVMVVGAGHLVGPDSVPVMLRARGVAVEGP